MALRGSSGDRYRWRETTISSAGVGGALLYLLSHFRRGLSVIAACIAGIATVLLTGGSFGLAGAAAAIFGVVLAVTLGAVLHAVAGRRLRTLAFVWSDTATDAEPVADFSVRSWRARGPSSVLPPFVERNVMPALRQGLSEKRFAILIGSRTSGKSRLIFELMKGQPQTVLVSRLLFAGGQFDPLLRLMTDHHGYWGSDGHQTLVMRSLTSRLLSGTIDREFMREWLDRHPNVSVVATFNDNDLQKITEAGEEGSEAFEELKKEAAVVTLSGELEGQELEIARQLYPGFGDEMLRFLPRYLCSASSLEERFVESAESRHALGHAIVCAAADWARAGISRPAPRSFLEATAHQYLAPEQRGDFESEMSWAVESLVGAGSLLYRVAENGVEVGFEADGIVRDLRDQDESGRLDPCLPEFLWEAIWTELVAAAEKSDSVGPIEDLVSLQETAEFRRGPDFRDRLMDLVPELDAYVQRERLVEGLVSPPEGGSVRSLIQTRVGDGIYRRLTAVQQLAESPRASTQPRFRFRDRLFARIYVFRTGRAMARLAALVIMDALCADIGFLSGVGLLVWLTGDPQVNGETLGRLLAASGATAVGIFAVCGLYREDSPRADLPAILLAGSALGFIAFTVASEQRLAVAAAITAALVGTGLTVALANWFRTRYDRISRRWVRDHGFDAQTLLIGSGDQVKAARIALKDISRPTKVVGHLSVRGIPSPTSLGGVEDLPDIAKTHHVGRVLIVDPEIPPPERQRLADFCHAQGLLVEAVPSLPDLQPGGMEVVLGQSLVLMRLEPLWQRSPGFFLKRTFDVLAAAALLVLLSPLLFALALAVAVDCGWPIIIRTSRPGLGGKTFGMFRFRTSVDAIPSPFELADIDEDPGGGGATSLGQILRRHGLDELPQLGNVLIGEMSLVGPRPLPLVQHLELAEEDLRRYVVRPGVTGPWQVCGRTELSYSELTKLDVAYLRQWSFFSDLAVLFKTVKLMIVSRPSFPHLIGEDKEAVPLREDS